MTILKIAEVLQSYSEGAIAYKLDGQFANAVTEAVSLLIGQGEKIADLENELSELRKKERWHTAEEMPPTRTEVYEDKNEKVVYQISDPLLIITKDGNAAVARCGVDYGKTSWFSDDCFEYDVALWRCVPKTESTSNLIEKETGK